MNELKLPFLKVLSIFIRNKIVEVVPIIGIVIAVSLGAVGLYFALYGIGWLMHTYLPVSWGFHLSDKDIQQGAYPLPPLLLLMLTSMLVLILVFVYTLIVDFKNWISDNWKLAKQGIKI